MDPWEWLADIRRQVDAHRQRERAGEPTVRAVRESVETLADDVYKPTRDTRKVGYGSHALIGTGANLTLDLDSGSEHRSWLWISIWQFVTATNVPELMAYPVWLYGADSLVGSSPLVAMISPPFANRYPIWAFRIPGRYARVVILGATSNTRTFQMVGYWQQDR